MLKHFKNETLLLIMLLCLININSKVFDENEIKNTIKEKGYPIIGYKIETADGFLLKLFRIPGKKGETFTDEQLDKSDRKPVLFMHGLLDSSDCWFINEESKSLPLLLANKGYDVWIGNNRGNKYSVNHKNLSIESKQFWDFSLHEMGTIDLPTKINFILLKNLNKKVTYVGHSQGGAQVYALCSLRPDYCQEKITGIVALAPAVFVDKSSSYGLKTLISFNVDKIMSFFNIYYILLPQSESKGLSKFCKVFPNICKASLKLVSEKEASFNNELLLSEYLSRYPAGASVKSFLHFRKLYSTERFVQFENENDYPLHEITIPSYIHIGKHDLLVGQTEGVKLSSSLTSKKKMYYYDQMGHLTFFLTKGHEEFIDNVMNDIELLNN